MSFIKNILQIFILGSSNYLNSLLIIIAGLMDSILYITCFYLSILNDDNNNNNNSKQQKETIDLLMRTQNDLYDLIKDLVQNTTTNQILIQNSLNQLKTLEFIHKDSLMIIKNTIYENNSISTDQMYFYICTYSFLLYIYQIFQWILHYFILKNSKIYFLYSYILSGIILSQSLGLIYCFHITNTFYSLLLLYIYTWIFFIRNLFIISHQTYSN